MLPISVVNGPIHNDIRLPECFIACYRRLDSRVRREGKEREKQKITRKRGKDEGTPVRFAFKRSFGPFCSLALTPTPPTRFLFFCFLFFFSAHFSLSCPHDLNACNRLNASGVLLSLFFKTLFSYLNCN